jgi:hypothetical protein
LQHLDTSQPGADANGSRLGPMISAATCFTPVSRTSGPGSSGLDGPVQYPPVGGVEAGQGRITCRDLLAGLGGIVVLLVRVVPGVVLPGGLFIHPITGFSRR